MVLREEASLKLFGQSNKLQYLKKFWKVSSIFDDELFRYLEFTKLIEIVMHSNVISAEDLWIKIKTFFLFMIYIETWLTERI